MVTEKGIKTKVVSIYIEDADKSRLINSINILNILSLKKLVN